MLAARICDVGVIYFLTRFYAERAGYSAIDYRRPLSASER